MPQLLGRVGRVEQAGGETPAAGVAVRPRGRILAGAVALLGLAALVVLLLVAFSGSGEVPPATGAAALVPSDALVYIHLSTDPARPAVRRADALMARLPDHGAAITALAQRAIDVVGGSTSTRFGRDIRPWLGPEAAFAFLNTAGSSAGSLIVLSVRNPRLARAFIAREGARAAGRAGGTTLYQYPTGAELAFVHGYLVVGLDAGVRAAVAAAAGRLASLAANPTYRRAMSDAPAGRVLDAYVSAAGVARVLDARTGLLSGLGALLSSPGELGTAVSVSATAPGLTLYMHSALDPAQAGPRPGTFTPTLASVLPAGSTLMLDTRDLPAVAPTVMAAIGQIGLLSGVPDLLHRLGGALAAEGVSTSPFLKLLRGETAVALARGTGAPALVIVSRTANEQAARIALANLEAPLAQVFAAPASGPGVAPEVNDVEVGGVTAHQLQLGPGLQVDDAVFRGLVVISTSLRGIADVAARSGALSDAAGYRSVLENRASGVTTLGFADSSQLFTLGEQSTLASSATYRALLPDLERIRAVGMDTRDGEADTTAELSLQIP